MQTVDVLARYREWLRSPSDDALNALLADMQCHVLSLSDDFAQVLMSKLQGINAHTYYSLTACQSAANTIAVLNGWRKDDHE